MIRLPETPALQRQPINAPQMSAQAAAAPATALGNVGRAIAGIGEGFAKVAEDAQRLENARIASERRNQLALGFAELQNELARESDPATIVEKTRQFFIETKGQADDPDLPNDVRHSLLMYHDDLATRGMIQAGSSAANLTAKRAGLAYQNEITTARDYNDPARAMQALASAQADGLLLPEERAAKERELNLHFQTQQITQDIQESPQEWIDRNPVNSPPPGFDATTWGRYHDFAESKLRESGRQIADLVMDGIASGQVLRPEDIDAIAAGKARPAVIAELKGKLADYTDAAATAARKARMQDPNHQDAVMGAIEAKLQTYEPDADGIDEDMIQLKSMAYDLPEGPMRQETLRRVDALRDGHFREVKTYADLAKRALVDHFKAFAPAGSFEPPKIPVRQFVDQGFLKDAANLTALGFSQEQISKIEEPVKRGKSETPPTNEVRLERFRALWPSRSTANDAKADPFKLRVAQTISERKTVIPASQEEEAAAARARIDLGRAMRRLNDFLKVNPKPSSSDIEGIIFSIGGEAARNTYRSGVFDPPPAPAFDPVSPSFDATRPDLPTGGIDPESPSLLPPIND